MKMFSLISYSHAENNFYFIYNCIFVHMCTLKMTRAVVGTIHARNNNNQSQNETTKPLYFEVHMHACRGATVIDANVL